MSGRGLFSGGGSGSIWDYFNEYSGGSAVEKMVEKEDTKFMDVVSNNGLLQELKSNNAKVVTYFCDEEKISTLLKLFFIEEEYESTEMEKYVYKFPHLVMEILTCEMTEFNKIFLGTDRLYEHFFTYLLKHNEENMPNKGLIYYYLKTCNHLIEKNYESCLEFFFRFLSEKKKESDADFLERFFLRHFGIFQFERFFLEYLGLFIRENELGAMIVGTIGTDSNQSALTAIFGANALSRLSGLGGRRALMSRRAGPSEEQKKKIANQKRLRLKFCDWLISCDFLTLILNKFVSVSSEEETETENEDFVRSSFEFLRILVNHNEKFPLLFDYLVSTNLASTISFLFTKKKNNNNNSNTDEMDTELRCSATVFVHGMNYLVSTLDHVLSLLASTTEKLSTLNPIAPERASLEESNELYDDSLDTYIQTLISFVWPYLKNCNNKSVGMGKEKLVCVRYGLSVVKYILTQDTLRSKHSKFIVEFTRWMLHQTKEHPFHNILHGYLSTLIQSFFSILKKVDDDVAERFFAEEILQNSGFLRFVIDETCRVSQSHKSEKKEKEIIDESKEEIKEMEKIELELDEEEADFENLKKSMEEKFEEVQVSQSASLEDSLKQYRSLSIRGVDEVGYIGYLFQFSKLLRDLKNSIAVKVSASEEPTSAPSLILKSLETHKFGEFEENTLTPKLQIYEVHLGGVDVKNNFLMGGMGQGGSSGYSGGADSSSSSDTTSSSDTDSSSSDDETMVRPGRDDSSSSTDSTDSTDSSFSSSDSSSSDEEVVRVKPEEKKPEEVKPEETKPEEKKPDKEKKKTRLILSDDSSSSDDEEDEEEDVKE